MTNKGKLAHVMMIVQAAPGLTGEEALEKFDSGGVAAVYGSYVAVPGEDEVLTVDLVQAATDGLLPADSGWRSAPPRSGWPSLHGQLSTSEYTASGSSAALTPFAANHVHTFATSR